MPAARLAIAALLSLGASSAPAAQPADAAVERHIAAATRLAGDDLRTPLFLCRPDGGRTIGKALTEGIKAWRPPVKLFDSLYFIGNGFIGTYVVKTSEGLVLFDALMGDDAMRDRVIPGLIELGLDPKTIRYAIVTHGHWEHYAGGPYLQRTYGTRIGLAAADWDFMSRRPPDAPEIAGHAPPKRDLVIEDGQELKLGDTNIRLYITPGHTAGTVSAIIPIKHQGKTLVFSLMGGTAFPAALQPNELTAGLNAFDTSVKRLAKLSAEAGAVGYLNTHAFADGGLERIDTSIASGNGSSLIVGKDGVRRYYALLHECLAAAKLRAAAEPPVPGRAY